MRHRSGDIWWHDRLRLRVATDARDNRWLLLLLWLLLVARHCNGDSNTLLLVGRTRTIRLWLLPLLSHDRTIAFAVTVLGGGRVVLLLCDHIWWLLLQWLRILLRLLLRRRRLLRGRWDHGRVGNRHGVHCCGGSGPRGSGLARG